jgi:uncharacterized membrane protein
MKRIAAFLKATTIGGLFVVLPIVLVFALLAKAVMTVHGIAQSLVEKMAGQHSEAAHFPILFSVLIVIAISFAFGLAMISHYGRTTGRWVEGKFLFRVPGYAAVRAIVGGLSGAKREGVAKSGLLTSDPGIEAFVLIIEDHGGDHLTVFLPGSPNPASGNVQIVRRDLVRILNVRITDIGSALQQWGMGSEKVLAKHSATPPAK